VSRPAGLIIALYCFASCLELTVEPRIMERDALVADPAPGSPRLHISVTGKGSARVDFARAYPASRTPISFLFGRRLKNTTGSIATLLVPALAEAARRKGYVSLQGRAGARPGDRMIHSRVEAVRFEWTPPQEFILTPGGKRPGTVTAELRISTLTRLYPGTRDVSLPVLDFRRTIHVHPPGHKRTLEYLTERALRLYAEHVLKHLPPAAMKLKSRRVK